MKTFLIYYIKVHVPDVSTDSSVSIYILSVCFCVMWKCIDIWDWIWNEIILNIDRHFVYLQYMLLNLYIYMLISLLKWINMIVLISFQVNAGQLRKLIIFMYMYFFSLSFPVVKMLVWARENKQIPKYTCQTNPHFFTEPSFVYLNNDVILTLVPVWPYHTIGV